jgi:hypothetical protein
MDGVLLSAASAAYLRVFLALRVELNSGSIINLVDGSGVVTFPVNGASVTFTGYDPVFGSLGAANSISERVADEAPKFSATLMPPSENALGTLNDPVQQGSKVYAWWGLYNDDTGAVIGTPELLWNGRLDTVKTNFDDRVMTAELSTVSAFDRLFSAEEGQRLNGVWHKSIWPGETGLDAVYDAQSDIYWGAEAPAK